MSPTLSDHQDLELRRAELNLAEAATEEPHAIAALAASLLRQNALQQMIIQKAAARILELEAREALAQRPTPGRPWWAISWPRLW